MGRSLTQTHFRHHTPLLIDIILDANADIVFEERLVEWISNVFSAWIYKLSLKYSNRLEGVKKMFVQLLMNSMQYLNRSNGLRLKMRMIPQFVDYFVQRAKAFHLVNMQKQHSSQQQLSSSSTSNTSVSNRNSSFSHRNDEQWVMNVEESE